MNRSAKTNIQNRKHRPDYSIVVVVSILLILGIVVLFSIGPALELSTGITVSKQLFSIAVALGGFLFTFLTPLDFWRKAQSYIVALAVISTTLLLLAPGEVINPTIKGAKRWLVFGPISFQPSELVKFALLIYLASFLASRVRHNKLEDFGQTFTPVVILTAVLGLVVVVLERDLGTMISIVAIIFTMLYISGLRLQKIGVFLGGLVASGALAVLVAPHRIERLTTFLNSGADLQDSGYHINQALIAVGSGGLFGLGLGKSVQAHGYLPEAANDSIFAIYAEKFGFLGTIVVISLFGFLLFKLIKIVAHAPNAYTRLLSAGVFAWLASHIIINIGAILGLMPLTGITLPFLSYGGSSLIFIMAAVGLILNVSRYTLSDRELNTQRKGGQRNASSRNRRRQRRARNPA